MALSINKEESSFWQDTPYRMLDIGEGRQATGIEVLCWAFTDTAHHRGQAEVYLRVKNIKPPRYVF